ncbi:MAG: sortase [Clostridia bacterium]|nr:sortase [Clostridia bacterium]
MKALRILLLVIAVVCIGVAVSYPIRYQRALKENDQELRDLSAMRRRVREEQGIDEARVDSGLAFHPDPETEADDTAVPQDGAAVPPVEGTASAAPGQTPTPVPEQATAQPGQTETSAPGPAETSASGQTQTSAAGHATTEPGPIETTGPEQTATTVPGETAAPAPGQATAQPGRTATSEPEQTATTLPGETSTSMPGQATTSEPQQATSEPEQTPTSVPGETATSVPGQATTSEPRQATAQPGPIETTGTEQTQTTAPGETAAPAPEQTATSVPEQATPSPEWTPQPTPIPDVEFFIIDDPDLCTPTPSPSPTPTPSPTPLPSPTPDRSIRTGALAYDYLEKVELDETKILPELRDIYEINKDLVGWIYIDDTGIDYPVVQSEDSDFYLKHDFYGNSNVNGQIILDTTCDPYTPSYNLIISGHHMNSGAMFARLIRYKDKKHWEKHRMVEFDTLMSRKQYVIFAAFNSADYDEDESGFRYNADIRYKIDADQWIDEVRRYQLYDTGIDVRFGDEFITLTTCDHSRRKDGRFVVVARRIREGEMIQ